MTAGIPGVGISGLFYILSALWMPLRELLTGRRRGSTGAARALVVRQTMLAVGILAAMSLTAWLMGRGLTMAFPNLPARTPTAAAWLVAPLSLAGVYLTLLIVRFVLDLRGGRPPVPPT